MAQTKSQIRTWLDRLLGDHADIADGVIDDFMEVGNEEILELHDWDGKHVHLGFDTAADYTTGTVSATDADATITGVSTVWTSALTLNRYMRIDGTDIYHKIITFTDATSVELETNWEIANVSTKTYAIFSLYNTPATDADEVLSIVHDNRNLHEVTREFIDHRDPNRDSTGNPTYWAVGPRDTNNDYTFELHPRPTAKEQLQIHYLKEATIASDTDEMVYPASLLFWKAAAGCADYLSAQLDDSAWERKALRFLGSFERLLPKAVQADKDRSGLPTQTRDVMTGLDDELGYQHWIVHAE